MSGTARKPRERRVMDVKVLYTLSTMPNSTMVARLGRPMPIEISNAPRLKRNRPSNHAASSPGGGNFVEGSRHGNADGPNGPAPQFGHVTLKACLSAICIASPELVIDRRKDWSLYVTDPKEHYRWTIRQQAAASQGMRSSNVASGSRGTSTSPSKDNRAGPSSSSSSSRSSQVAPQNFEAGKGLFSWVLAEPDEGTSTVTGRVVSDAHSHADSDFSDDESDEEFEVLEVVLRLSEMPAQSKNDYFETLRVLSSSSATAGTQSTAPAPARPAVAETPLANITSAVEARRLRRSMATSAFGSASMTQSSPVKAYPVPRAPHALRSSPVQARVKGRGTSQERGHENAPPAAPADGVASSSSSSSSKPFNTAFSNQQLQFLGLLQSYTAQTAAPPPPAPVQAAAAQVDASEDASKSSPDLQGFLHALVSSLSAANNASGQAQASMPSVSPTTAAVPLPAATPCEEQPAIAASQAPGPAPTTTQAASTQTLAASTPALQPLRASLSSVAPPGSSPILNGPTPGYDSDMSYASPRPGGGSLIAATPGPSREVETPGSVEGAPKRQCYNCGMTGNRTWRYVAPAEGRAAVRFLEGSETTAIKDAKCTVQYRACNACAQYFKHKRGKAHRPEEVWKKAIARKRAGRSAKRKATDDAEEGPARTPATGTETGSPTEEDELSDLDDAAGGAKHEAKARSGSFARTLSAVAERDAKRIKMETAKAEATAKSRPIIVEKYEDARLKDFLIDADGRLRTKRAIKDNPAGRRPGRPKGSKSSRPRVSKSRFAAEGGAKTSPPPVRRSPQPSRTSPAHAVTSPAAGPFPSVTADGEGPAAPHFQHPEASRSSPPPPPSSATQSASNATGIRPILGATPAKARYGAPDHLLQSSPGTALGMLLSEGDTDWNQLGPGFTPVRRSPRKQPPGTRSGLNPYASTAIGAHGSPTLDRNSWGMGQPGSQGAAVDQLPGQSSNEAPAVGEAATTALAELMSINETSPITRGRLRSLRFDADAHPALFTSSDEADGSRAMRSSASALRRSYSSPQTSPGSPTPSGASRRANGKHGRTIMSDSLASMRSQFLGGPMLSAGPAAAPKQRPARSPSAERKSARQARSKAAAALVDDLGPFMGTISTSPLCVDQDGDDEEDGEEGSVGIGSPTLGAAQRRRETKRKASAELGRITSHSPSDIFEFLNQDALAGGKPSAPVAHEWDGAEGVPDFFNSPSSTKVAASAKPSASTEVSGSASAPGAPTGAPATTTSSSAVATTTVARVPRRPLPATVEDASSSSASSSPQDEISPSSAGETPMSGMEVFEDPYGLLAMHGFGPNANGQITADTVPQHIQTFAKSAFGAHLAQFTQQGATGVAAQIVGDASGGLANGDGSFEIASASTVPAAKAIPPSPRRSLHGQSPANLLALQATPTRMRTRSQASTPLKSPDYLSAFLNALATTPTASGRSSKGGGGGSPSKSLSERPHANANFSPTTAALLANFDLLPNPFLAAAATGGGGGGGGASSKGISASGLNIDHATAKELFPGAFGSPVGGGSPSKRRRLALEASEEVGKERAEGKKV